MLISFKTLKQDQEKKQKEYKAGEYKVRIIKAEEHYPTDKTPYLEVTFETMEDDIFSVRKRFYLTEKAESILLNLLGAVGIYDKEKATKYVEKGEAYPFEAEDLVGSVLQVEFVKGEPNAEGRQYLEYKSWSAKAISGLATPKKAKAKVEDEVDEDSIPF